MKNDYAEVKCRLKPDTSENRNILIAFLSENGFDGFLETEEGINAYIPEKKFSEKDTDFLKETFFDFELDFSLNIIKDENWNETWTKNYFEPIIFGKKLAVRASFHPEIKNVEREIIIDPKTAFGTGNHATTYMLIEEILNLNVKNKRILDMGTGTGILAILSKMRGAGYTLAADNDIKSVINTQENIIVNKVPDIEVKEGTMQDVKEAKFDIIYENIWKNIVINDMPALANSLVENGILLTSGFYYNEYKDVKKAGEKNGLKFVKAKEKDGWAVVKFIKKPR